MSKKSKLKPCPFCGDSATMTTEEYGGSAKFVSEISCDNCGVTKSDLYGPPEEAAARWNQRVTKKK
jgi:Lar family restriction alleviation protein